MTVLKRSAIGTPIPTYWIAVAPVILAVEGHAVTTSRAGVLRQILTPATVYVSGRLFERAANLAGQINAVRIVASDHGSAGIAEVAGAAAAALAVAGVPVTQIITEMTLEQAQSGHVAVLIVSLLVMAVVMAAVGMIGLASSQGTNVTERERTMADGAASVEALCRIAAERGLPVDMHCDETDDPMSRHVETLAAQTIRFGLQSRVAGSHLTSMHSMDNYYVSKLIPMMAEAKLHAIANPLINIMLQGWHDTYPKRRGMTRVPELLAAGVNVAFGHDCVMDPWYSMGSGDMLEVGHMAIHVAQMASIADKQKIFDIVTHGNARAIGLEGYGLEKGCNADLVILQARDPVEALRLKANRLTVIRRGRIVAETAPRISTLTLDGRPAQVDGAAYAPTAKS